MQGASAKQNNGCCYFGDGPQDERWPLHRIAEDRTTKRYSIEIRTPSGGASRDNVAAPWLNLRTCERISPVSLRIFAATARRLRWWSIAVTGGMRLPTPN